MRRSLNPAPAARAARLLRWYPRAWRSRYGDEFAELLVADIEERPRSRSRTADVIRGGLVARLGQAGLSGGGALEPGTARTSASLASLGCCAVIFAGVGGAMWSQLTAVWQFPGSAPADVIATIFVMSAAMLVLAVLALLAVFGVAWRVIRLRPPSLRGPSALFAAGLAVVVVGGRHFENGWPGTGGHHLSVVPSGVAAFSWASTMSVSSFWAHPAVLAVLPRAELAWMALSPLAVAAAVAGAVTAVRRAGRSPGVLSPAVLRFEARLGRAACVAMAVFLGGACAWVTAWIPRPFHPGAIDVAGLVILTLALAVARQAASQAGAGAR
jgi:hypothetical protein